MTGADPEHPFAALVRERRGAAVADAGDAAELDARAVGFAAILARDEETLPPVARVGPWQAAGWLLLGMASVDDGEVASAQRLAEALDRAALPAYLLTAGRVGGGAADPGSREIPSGLVARVLDAALAGEVDWEADPDFGYELPMELPGIGAEERRILVPRFLYARTDRVYDYAAMVPRLRRERAARLEAIAGLPSPIADAFDAPARRRRDRSD